MTSTLDPRTAPEPEVQWVKARDTMLSGSGRGTSVGGQPIDSEAALVISVAGATIAIEGSYRRLLKLLDYARDRLLVTVPQLVHVMGVPEGEDPEDFGDPIPGLRCPYPSCQNVVWTGDEDGIRVIDAGERHTTFGFRAAGPEGGRLAGEFTGHPHMETDRYECEACDRPVALPDDVTEP